MEDNTLENFNEWDKVVDYASDETSVDLIDKDGKVIAKYNYPNFSAIDFDYFKKI